MTKESLIEKWRKKIEGREYVPPIDYSLIFNETVKNYAKEDYSLLDIGTGAGKTIFENELFKSYRKLIGIDIEPEMIKICQEEAQGLDNVEFFIMDSTKEMGFEDNSFNVITVRFAPYKPSEISRLLARDGHFILLWGLKGDHKEITDLFPGIFEAWEGRFSFETFEERRKKLNDAGLEIVGHNTLQYQWIFRDKEALKEFYQKILLTPIFKGRENRLEKLRIHENGEIPISRIIDTTIARKI